MSEEEADRNQRRVVCAAIRKNGVIIHAPRHYDNTMHHYIETWRLAGMKQTMADAEQGFIDQRGKFMTREEAFEVATKAGQILQKTGNPDSKELFSEDLY